MIISGFLSIVDFIIGLLPLNLPGSGQTFQETLGFLKGYLDNVISFIYSYVVSYEVVKSIFTLLIVWLSAKITYHMFFWVIRKLPLGIEQ